MWLEGIRLFGEATGAKATYEYKPIGAFIKDIPDRMLGEELGDKFLYSHEPGYDGADKSLLRASDIRKLGVECPMTSLEEWMKMEDFSNLLGTTK